MHGEDFLVVRSSRYFLEDRHGSYAFFFFFFILSFEKSQKDRYLVLKYTTDGEPFNREPLIEHILKMSHAFTTLGNKPITEEKILRRWRSIDVYLPSSIAKNDVIPFTFSFLKSETSFWSPFCQSLINGIHSARNTTLKQNIPGGQRLGSCWCQSG